VDELFLLLGEFQVVGVFPAVDDVGDLAWMGGWVVMGSDG
jgi:hypothetical protein